MKSGFLKKKIVPNIPVQDKARDIPAGVHGFGTVLQTMSFAGLRSFLRVLLVGALLNALIPSFASSQTMGSSPSAPALPGTTVVGIVECGEGYTSHELYDMKITLLEVIRGEDAWNRLQKADPSNKPADAGMEYVLARVKFEYYARGVPGLCVHQVTPDQFTAYSSKGEDYRPVAAVPPPPEMRKGLKSGDALEGWLVFAVAKGDKSPLLSYSVEAGGAVQHGESKWFLLR